MVNVDRNTDELYARRAAKGDLSAFDVLVARYEGRASAVAHHWCCDKNAVPDVVDEAFTKAFRSIGAFRGDCAFSTWLHRIVVNASLDMNLRGKTRLVEVPLTDARVHLLESGMGRSIWLIPGGFEDGPDPSARLLQVTLGIAKLPEDKRELLFLRYFKQASYRAIASLLDIKIGTVRSRLNRARADLRTKLGIRRLGSTR